MLYIQGAADETPVTFWGMHWSLVGEALLLSLALAARTRMAQQQAITNLKMYEDIYNNSIEGLFQFDFITQELKCNTALARLFGYHAPSELKIYNDVLTHLPDNARNELTLSLMKYDSIKDYETTIESLKEQKAVWVSITMRVIKDSRNRVISAEGSMTDISERKLKEDAEKGTCHRLKKQGNP